MNLSAERMVGILNGFINPLMLCAFLPVIEGASTLDLVSPKGFWGQLAVAVVIAEVLSSLPLFGRVVSRCLSFFDFEPGSPGHKIAGTVVGATLLFVVIGFGEIVFQGGVGIVGGRTFFVRWASLITKGWGFVIVSGVLIDPFTSALGHMVARRLGD